MNEVAERTLTETIERLERRVKQLETDLRAAQSVSLEDALGSLRARQAILLYVGAGTTDDFHAEVARDMRAEVARAASRHLFDLTNAALPNAEREAVRALFNGGMSRF